MRPSLLTTLLIAAACAEGDVSTLPDAGSIRRAPRQALPVQTRSRRRL